MNTVKFKEFYFLHLWCSKMWDKTFYSNYKFKYHDILVKSRFLNVWFYQPNGLTRLEF